ncbi:MAG: hypothetical protein E6I43_09945, partial [Chloroflexi bacterium]
LELSSFQLESITTPRLNIGVVLNVTPDHLDRHKSFAHYVEIKARAVAFMQPEDHAVLNVDDPACAGMRPKTRGQVLAFGLRQPVDRGVTLADGWITIAHAAVKRQVLPAAEVPLPGEHKSARRTSPTRCEGPRCWHHPDPSSCCRRHSPAMTCSGITRTGAGASKPSC